MPTPKLIIRDSHATINRDPATVEMPSGGLEIIADDGRTLFSLRLTPEGVLDLSAGSFCKHEGKIFDDRLLIAPRSSNCVTVRRPEYEDLRKIGATDTDAETGA